MSLEAIDSRLRLKAAEPKFSPNEETILVGWAIYNDLSMLSTTTNKFREYVFRFLFSSFSSKSIKYFFTMKVCIFIFWKDNELLLYFKFHETPSLITQTCGKCKFQGAHAKRRYCFYFLETFFHK